MILLVVGMHLVIVMQTMRSIERPEDKGEKLRIGGYRGIGSVRENKIDGIVERKNYWKFQKLMMLLKNTDNIDEIENAVEKNETVKGKIGIVISVRKHAMIRNIRLSILVILKQNDEKEGYEKTIGTKRKPVMIWM